ncbi:protein NKG7-like [Pseudophryne corroboree]|uniref:protein NKG7-like n=1 Tax=Pseudophryne corroboree TaxID=495146 RepID=UPI00308140C7
MLFCKWKFGIFFLQQCTNVLAITALVTDYWGVIPSTSGNFGLFRYCDKVKECLSIPVTGDVINLLIAMFIIGIIVLLPCAIVDLRMNFGCLSCQGVLSFLMALLGFAAMTHAAVIFSSFFAEISYHYSWSFALGWLSVVLAIISGALSFYICRMDPESKGLSWETINDSIVAKVGPSSAVPAPVDI